MVSHPGKPRHRRSIPKFALYGERSAPGQEILHIEDVRSRSQLYRWEIEPHVHTGLHQVLCLHEGRADVALDDWQGSVAGPAAIVAPPGVVHGFRFAPDTDGHVLTLSPRLLLEGDFQQVGQSFQTLFDSPGVIDLREQPADADRLRHQLAGLTAEFNSPDAADSPVIGWLARAVVWRLARMGERRDLMSSATDQQSLFTRYLMLIEAHYAEHWSMDDYAAKLGLSTQRLNRLVRAQRQCSALTLVHERLIREACRRLLYVAAPAASLSMELGFEDPAYFSRFFKRHTGMSPQQWRRSKQGAPASD
ncbi:helix-turn-helix domain-containing protein [Hydrogenophaga sp. 5NK40-0174]|uniref:helix-turn-helix domain-containing protein n=1 Tax=Hydrogenophaga sp. 5NK40-0174 TaxID=3127649 RepID=UPI003108A027